MFLFLYKEKQPINHGGSKAKKGDNYFAPEPNEIRTDGEEKAARSICFLYLACFE